MTEKGDRLFWIWLSRALGEENAWYPLLLEKFGTPYDIFRADEEELDALIPELGRKEKAALLKKNLDDAYEIMEYCKRNEYQLLCYDDRRYPLSYRSLKAPPLLLYYRGALPDFQTWLHIAVVGPRKMSEYGCRTAYKIAYELACAGAVIVSGMALGVDSIASCAALAAGGSTVAILGSGIDVPYPPEHAGFQRVLEQKALVMTEYAPGSEPLGYHFPQRNRLISGLAQGTLVVEGDERSGALITAERALMQGRDVYAIPANVGDKNAAGTNALIRDGARVALCADDILKHYQMLFRDTLKQGSASMGQRSDYDADMALRMGVYTRASGGRERVLVASLREERVPIKKNDASAKNKRTPKVRADAPEKPKPCEADHSSERLASLGERERKVFEAIPMDRPVAIDRLQSLGYATGEVLAALSLLEIQGLVQSLPGGLYSRL